MSVVSCTTSLSMPLAGIGRGGGGASSRWISRVLGAGEVGGLFFSKAVVPPFMNRGYSL